MRYCLTVLILVAFPGPSYAAVYVESGEHPGYSRVVMQFERSPNWTFGRVADGYELRISDPETEFDGDALISSLDGKLARFKLPKYVSLLEALPRNANGKIVKSALLEKI